MARKKKKVFVIHLQHHISSRKKIIGHHIIYSKRVLKNKIWAHITEIEISSLIFKLIGEYLGSSLIRSMRTYLSIQARLRVEGESLLSTRWVGEGRSPLSIPQIQAKTKLSVFANGQSN